MNFKCSMWKVLVGLWLLSMLRDRFRLVSICLSCNVVMFSRLCECKRYVMWCVLLVT